MALLSNLTAETVLATVACGECGGTYAISERYRQQKEDERGFWHCPYCQVSWGYGEGKVQRLEKQLAQERARSDQARARAKEFERSMQATKGHLTRLKQRVANGVCPCCQRQFANLAQHMRNQHPEYPVSEAG